jgi:hypothetical protein
MFSQRFYPDQLVMKAVNNGRLSRAHRAKQEFSKAPAPKSKTVELFPKP